MITPSPWTIDPRFPSGYNATYAEDNKEANRDALHTEMLERLTSRTAKEWVADDCDFHELTREL